MTIEITVETHATTEDNETGIATGWEDQVFLDWRLRECNYGSRNGRAASELDREGHIDVAYPRGESWRQAIARVERCIDDLHRDWNGSRLLVIGHTSTRWAFDHVANGSPVEEFVGGPFEWQPGWDTRSSDAAFMLSGTA
jgi:2,3-bisphosphoglycerate-dependent phosphoglycerate mutase